MNSDKQRLVIATKINQQEIAAKQLDQKVRAFVSRRTFTDATSATAVRQINNTHEAHCAEMAAMRTRVDELENALHNYHHQLKVAIAQSSV